MSMGTTIPLLLSSSYLFLLLKLILLLFEMNMHRCYKVYYDMDASIFSMSNLL